MALKKKKRTTQPRRKSRSASVADRLDQITDIVSSNHIETIERLTRLETSLGGIPQRVEAIERRNQKLAGAIAGVSALFTALVAILKYFHT